MKRDLGDDAALDLQLDQARTAQRVAERGLRDHIREHALHGGKKIATQLSDTTR